MISWRLQSFEIDVYAFILSLCDIYLRSNSLFSNTTPASIVDMKKNNMKNHLLSELLSFLFHGISSLPAMGKSLFRKFWKSLWIWFLKRHTEWSGVRVWRGRRATEDAWPWPETTDPDICQNRGGEEPTNESTTIFTWVNDWCSLNHLKAEHRS